ncbi:MAG: transcriptional regulator, PadR-family [Geminicoccaceae bacterium]|nr:transcriptional regulator, PadR-family [Geminicoccaceae bacterium]
MARDPHDLLYGSLDLLILRTLAWEPMHGYGISSFIRQRTAGVFEIVDAALYKSLHRLERQGFIDGEWGVTDENRRAKFYKLTHAGRAALRAETSAWRQYVEAVDKVLEPA